MIRNLLLGLMLPFLAACATAPASTPLPPEQPPSLDALLRHTEVEGDIKRREDASNGRELWDFTGELQAALARANNDKDLVKKQLSVQPPKPCMRWAKALHLCRS